MSEILSQSEIEALLATLSDAPPTPSMAPEPVRFEAANDMRTSSASLSTSKPAMTLGGANRHVGRTGMAYELYDFRRSDKFSKDQLRTLQILHETFARLGGTALSAYLRTPVNVELIALEQLPYEEYISSINNSVFTIMSIPPLTGQAVMEMEFQLVFTMLDKLLGGPGKGIHRNNLTDIEKPLVRQMVERLFLALKNAWEGVVIVNPGIEAMETSAQFVQIAPPNDIVVTILFEVRIGNSRGAISICIPYLLLKPITTKLSAQKWFVNTSRKHSSSNRRLLTQQVGKTTVEGRVMLGDCKLSMGDFINLSVGDMLQLSTSKDDNLVFLVGDTPKFEGKPGLKGKRLAFTILNAIKEQ